MPACKIAKCMQKIKGENEMGEVLLKTNLKRELGHIYYVKFEKDGTVLLCKAKMVHGRKKKGVSK